MMITIYIYILKLFCITTCIYIGIISVQVDGEKDQIIVIGEGVDPVCMTKKLRKKMGHVELIIVAPAKVDKLDDKLKPYTVWQGCHSQFIQHPFAYEYCGKPDPYCVIL